MGFTVALLLWGLAFVVIRAIRPAAGPSRDCLTCRRTVPPGEPLVPRRDLQLCGPCVAEGSARVSAAREGRQSEAEPVSDSCHFCGRKAAAVRPAVMLREAAICSECLETCRDLLEAEATMPEAAAPPAGAPDNPRTQPVRVVRIFRLGGIRMALKAGVLGLNDPAAYTELEHAIARALVLLAAHPIEQWESLSAGGFDQAIPRLGDRTGYMDVGGSATPDVAGRVVLEACLPFRFWPFGGWVAVDARHRTTDGTLHYLTQDEVERMW